MKVGWLRIHENWFGGGYWGDCRSQWIETYIGGSDHFPSNFGLGSRRSFQEESGVKAAWKKTSMIPRASKMQTNRSRYIKIIYHIPPKRAPPPSFSPDDFRKVPVPGFPIAKLMGIISYNHHQITSSMMISPSLYHTLPMISSDGFGPSGVCLSRRVSAEKLPSHIPLRKKKGAIGGGDSVYKKMVR